MGVEICRKRDQSGLRFLLQPYFKYFTGNELRIHEHPQAPCNNEQICTSLDCTQAHWALNVECTIFMKYKVGTRRFRMNSEPTLIDRKKNTDVQQDDKKVQLKFTWLEHLTAFSSFL